MPHAAGAAKGEHGRAHVDDRFDKGRRVGWVSRRRRDTHPILYTRPSYERLARALFPHQSPMPLEAGTAPLGESENRSRYACTGSLARVITLVMAFGTGLAKLDEN